LRGFVDAALELKDVLRQGWVDAGMEHPESVADHSYAVGVIAMLISDSSSLDTGRVVRMALLHDIAEGITGDIVPGSMDPSKKRSMERDAMNHILDSLPGPLRDLYRKTWQEYVSAQTPEARLVHDADRLDMGLQAHRYRDMLDSKTRESFLESARAGLERGKATGIIREEEP
jgi:putative hydrolase of HD superfamily